MIRICLISYLLCQISFSLKAQMEGDQWVLGYWNDNSKDHSIMFFDFRNAKLEISARPSIRMFITGCASNVCSNDGEPLIWTNGMQIMGADGNFIADTIAFDTGGYYWIDATIPGHIPFGFPEPDNAIILPVPGYSDEYSIIYHYNEEHHEFIYATTQYLEARVKDKNNGAFDLLYKDKPIGPREEWFNGTISSVRHANGRDWWLIYFLEDSPNYYVHLLDPSGIHFKHIGELDLVIREGLGQSTFSNQGNYFASMDAISQDSGEYISLFEFDRCEGNLIRKNTFHAPSGRFTGVAFSPSEQYLYADNNFELWQWDLKADNIAESKVLVDTFDGFVQPGWFEMRFGPMRTTPDGRIYIIPNAGSSKYLHVIDRPDLPSPGCKFLQHEIALDIWNGRTVPNIPNYRLGPLDGSSCDTLGLNNIPQSRWRYEPDQSDFPATIRFTDLSYFDPDTWLWDFDNGFTTFEQAPVHTFEEGLYHVCLTVNNEFATDSTCHWVEIMTTDVDDLTAPVWRDLYIAPNPFTDELVIRSYSGGFRDATISLYDMHGRAVFQQKHLPVPITISLPSIAPGMYLCIVEEKDQLPYSFSVMKQ